MPRLPGLVGLRQALGHDALETHAAGLREHQFAAVIGVVDYRDAGEPAIDQARQALLASTERQRSIVDAIKLEQVEGERVGMQG
jgi:hypothetical protein